MASGRHGFSHNGFGGCQFRHLIFGDESGTGVGASQGVGMGLVRYERRVLLYDNGDRDGILKK